MGQPDRSKELAPKEDLPLDRAADVHGESAGNADANPFAETSARAFAPENAAALKATAWKDGQAHATGVPELVIVAPEARGEDAHPATHKDATRHADKPKVDPVTQFTEDTGVAVVKVDGNFQYVMCAMGAELPLFQTEPTLEGLQEARRQLQEMARAKESELTHDYRVGFGAAGEVADKQYRKDATGHWQQDGPELKCRQPTLPELYGIEYALRHSEPSQLTADGKDGVKFYFLEQKHWKGLPPTYAEHGVDINGRAAVFIEPRLYARLPVTEDDSAIVQMENRLRNRFKSMEEVIVHELAHNSAANDGWNELQAGQLQTPAEQIAERLGWKPKDPEDQNGWYLEGKDGFLYKLTRQIDGKWVRYDQDGKPVNAAGHRVPDAGQAVHLDSAHMRDVARITPPSSYFDNPSEEFAETLTRFRLRADTRQKLAKDHPDLYDLAKQYDQQEIDRAYGVDENGQPKFVRTDDGSVVPNKS